MANDQHPEMTYSRWVQMKEDIDNLFSMLDVSQIAREENLRRCQYIRKQLAYCLLMSGRTPGKDYKAEIDSVTSTTSILDVLTELYNYLSFCETANDDNKTERKQP